MSFCSHCYLPSKGGGKDGEVVCSYGCRLAMYLERGKRSVVPGVTGLGIFFLALSLLINVQNSVHQFLLVSAGQFLIVLPWLLFLFSGSCSLQILLADVALLMAVSLDYGFSTWSLFSGGVTFNTLFGTPFIGVTLLLIWIPLSAVLCAALQRRSTADLRRLFGLRPKFCRLLVKNQPSEVSPNDLKVGDQILVNPGEIIPADGVILSGTTSVDESGFTAEKTILFKEQGGCVIGGSLNRDGVIVMRIVTAPMEHFHQKIVSLLKVSLGSEFVFRRIFFVLPLALGAVAIAIPVIKGGVYDIFAMTAPLFLVLVVVGVATRIRFLSMLVAKAVGWAAANGIVIKQTGVLHYLARMNTLFFGKTGTMTQGHFHYSEQFVERGTNEEHFLSTIFSLEAESSHPIASGMTTHPWYLEIARLPVTDYKNHAGLGVSGIINNRSGEKIFAAVGNQRFLKRLQIQISRGMREKVDELEQIGDTVILCGWDGEVRGLLSFADSLRSDVKPFLTRLQALRIKPIMITGDHDEMCAHLAHTAGLSQIYTRCLPEEKGAKIQNRKQKRDIVGMMGSSADEETAFCQSDVGILINTGTRFVTATAGVSIFGRNLLKVIDLIGAARLVFSAIRWGAYTATLASVALLLGFIFNLSSPALTLSVLAVLFLVLASLSLWYLRPGPVS